MMESLDFEDFKVSIKSTNVPNTIAANRLLSERIPYPIHLGITEAGTKWSGSLKSAVGLGTLLADGVGDTIRICLSTFHAEEEVKVAWEILKALQLRERGPVLIACPTCGRLQFDMDSVVAEIERGWRPTTEPIEVAVLGCAVNGIGEASHADFGITGAKNEGLIFAHGKPLKKVPQDELVDALFAEIDKSLDRGSVEVDDAKAAEGAEWLAQIEEENADELTPERIAAMEAEKAREEGNDVTAEPFLKPVKRTRASTRTPRRPPAAASPAPELDRPAASTTSTSSSPTSSAASTSTTSCSSRSGSRVTSEIEGERGERVVYIGGTGGASVSLREAPVRRPRDALRPLRGRHPPPRASRGRAASGSTSAPRGCASAAPRSRAARPSTTTRPATTRSSSTTRTGSSSRSLPSPRHSGRLAALDGAPLRPTSCRPCARTPPTPSRSRTG